MLFFSKKSISLIVIILSFLFITPVSFAGLTEVMAAIKNNDEATLLKELKAGFDSNTIEQLIILPLPNISKLLLNNNKPLDSTKFLNLIFNQSIRLNPKDDETLKKLVDLALAIKVKQVEFNKINSVYIPMIVGLGKYLLDKGMPADKLLELSMSEVISLEDIDKQRAIVNEALKKGVDINNFNSKYPWMTDVFAGKKPWHGLSQVFLLQRLNGSRHIFPDQKMFNTAIGNISLNVGCCYGLSTLWGHLVLLETKGMKNFKYTSDWFKGVIKVTAELDSSSKKALSKKNIDELQKFWELALTFQGSMGDINFSEVWNKLGMPEKYIKNIGEKYSTFAVFDSVDQLSKVLEKIVHEREFVYVYCPMHAMGIAKIGKYYNFLDPNNNLGVHRYTTIKGLAQAIYVAHNMVANSSSNIFTDEYYKSELKRWLATGRFTLAFSVIGDIISHKTYLTSQEESKFRNIHNIGDLYSAQLSAAYYPKLLEYLLGAIQNGHIKIACKIDKEKENIMYSMFCLALKLDKGNIVKDILKENKNLNINVPCQSMQTMSQKFASLGDNSLFLAAAMLGAVESMQAMLNLNRVNDINQTNKTLNKTALDFALEGNKNNSVKFKELVKLLQNNGAKTFAELNNNNKQDKKSS